MEASAFCGGMGYIQRLYKNRLCTITTSTTTTKIMMMMKMMRMMMDIFTKSKTLTETILRVIIVGLHLGF